MYTSREWRGNITHGGETLAFGKQYLGVFWPYVVRRGLVRSMQTPVI